MRSAFTISIGILVLAVGAACAATKITTQDGSVISGEIVSLRSGIYTIKTPYGTQNIPEASVRSIDSGEAPPSPAGGVTAATVAPPPAAPTNGPLRLAGSTTIGDDLAPALLESYAAGQNASDVTWTQEGSAAEQLMEAKGPNNTAFTAHVSRHGSGTAFVALADAKADIGMASRQIEPTEAAKLATAGLGDFNQPGQENVLALDGLIMIVNKENPVNALTIAQLRDIFLGKITDWNQLGSQSGPIHLVARDSKSGTADTFKSLVMGGKPVAGTAAIVDGAEGVALKVQGDTGAIGYTGFAYRGDNKAINIGTDCGLEFPPSELYVRTEEYPLSRRLYLYTPATHTNVASATFLNFALSDQGQLLVKKKNFIDLVPQLAPTIFGRNAIALDLVHLNDDHGVGRDDINGFMSYARIVVDGQRISTTFRFQFGSSALDARAARDIDRLADFLKTPSLSSKHVLIAGFADTVGSWLAGRRLSNERARQIAGLLHDKGIDAKSIVGYGRIAPVACNTTPEGRQKNRRVEVWVY